LIAAMDSTLLLSRLDGWNDHVQDVDILADRLKDTETLVDRCLEFEEGRSACFQAWLGFESCHGIAGRSIAQWLWHRAGV
jgi:hypothetical protein